MNSVVYDRCIADRCIADRCIADRCIADRSYQYYNKHFFNWTKFIYPVQYEFLIKFLTKVYLCEITTPLIIVGDKKTGKSTLSNQIRELFPNLLIIESNRPIDTTSPFLFLHHQFIPIISQAEFDKYFSMENRSLYCGNVVLSDVDNIYNLFS